MVNKKQYYIPGKEYEWTKETWSTVLERIEYVLADYYGPFTTEGRNVKGSSFVSEHECEGKSYIDNLDLCWEFLGEENYWCFYVSEEGVEIPEYLIPFYGESMDDGAGSPNKETLSVEDLEVGKEYIMSLGVTDDRHIVYWGRNQEVIFVTDLLYHTYDYSYIEDIHCFREVSKKTREEILSEKYEISLDVVNKMVEDGVLV